MFNPILEYYAVRNFETVWKMKWHFICELYIYIHKFLVNLGNRNDKKKIQLDL